MPTFSTNRQERSLRLAPQVVLLLDDETRVLNDNRGLAGNSFPALPATEHPHLHAWLHPDCDGTCHFREMWAVAWASLETRDSAEWEINDGRLNRLLRLNLSKAPPPRTRGPDRRKPQILLSITDITRYRRDYEALLEQQQSLIRLLLARSDIRKGFGKSEVRDVSESGRYLIPGFVRDDRVSGRQLLLAQEEERKRIAAELHDGVAQTIGLVKYKIEASLDQIGWDRGKPEFGQLESAVADLKLLIDEIRRISRNLAPSMLRDFGIQFALDWLCREFTNANQNAIARCVTKIDESETPDLLKIAVYRVVQEALNNTAKHAEATRVDVSLESKGGGLQLTIADNGAGVDTATLEGESGAAGGFGLRSMRERVEATEGRLRFESSPGRGTVVSAEWSEEALSLIR